MNIKLTAIGALAAGAVCVLAWQGYSNLGARDIRSAQSADRQAVLTTGEDGHMPSGPGQRVAMNPEDMPAWMRDTPEADIDQYTFPKLGDAVSALEEAPAILSPKFDDDEGASAVSTGGRQTAGEAWLSFVRPLVQNDQPGFELVVADLGGLTKPEASGDLPAASLYNRLNPILDTSLIALEQSRIRLADASKGGDVPAPIVMGGEGVPGLPPGMDLPTVMMMMMRTEDVDAATGETTARESLAIPLQILFPNAAYAVKKGGKVVEVWTPAKVKGSGGKKPDLGMSTYMVWNAGAKAWQPVSLRITFLSDEGRAKLKMGR